MNPQDIFLSNAIIQAILMAAAGGLASVTVVTEFFKTVIGDWKEETKRENVWLIDTRSGKRLLVEICALMYTLVIWRFNILGGEQYVGIKEFDRYIIFWIAISVMTMGFYDLTFKKGEKKVEVLKDIKKEIANVPALPQQYKDIDTAADMKAGL